VVVVVVVVEVVVVVVVVVVVDVVAVVDVDVVAVLIVTVENLANDLHAHARTNSKILIMSYILLLYITKLKKIDHLSLTLKHLLNTKSFFKIQSQCKIYSVSGG
jgi:hypothetical protein